MEEDCEFHRRPDFSGDVPGTKSGDGQMDSGLKRPRADGGSAGNIDVVLCAYGKSGKVYDFSALEV